MPISSGAFNDASLSLHPKHPAMPVDGPGCRQAFGSLSRTEGGWLDETHLWSLGSPNFCAMAIAISWSVPPTSSDYSLFMSTEWTHSRDIHPPKTKTEWYHDIGDTSSIWLIFRTHRHTSDTPWRWPSHPGNCFRRWKLGKPRCMPSPPKW